MSSTDSLVRNFNDIDPPKTDPEGLKCCKKAINAGSIILGRHNEDVPVKPSLFIQKMSLSSEDLYKELIYGHVPETLALHDMSLIGDQKITSFPISRPLFQPFPSELVFQRFEAGKSYELPLLLRNMDKVSRTAHLIQNDTPYFRIKRLNSQGSKVAAGLSLSFSIVFTPDVHQDYRHDLMCVTDRELFSIPVFCIGPRAILDLPDEICFGEVPVKVTNKKVLGIRNTGDGIAMIKLDTAKPFFVDPVVLKVAPGALEEITISFIPESTDNLCRKMFIVYNTGEKLQIDLHGKGVEAPVNLKDKDINLNGTFIGLHTQASVFIENNSSDFVSYKWSPFRNPGEESSVNEILIGTFSDKQDFESELKQKLITWIRNFSEQQIPYPTNIQTIECSPFNIEPIEGRIQPYSTQEFIVHFNPEKAKHYKDEFYCDIEGVTERLNLSIHGEGLGPRIKFSFKNLNMGKLFIGSKHKYELVLSNSGLIDTMFSIQSIHNVSHYDNEIFKVSRDDNNYSMGKFSKYFQFTPDEGLICPGGYQVIQIDFKCDNLLGEFSEIFKFVFDGSSTPEDITFSGTVVGPTFHFNVSEVEFNQVSYGFSQEKTITLHNTSFIPMDFILRVVSDDIINDNDDNSKTLDSLTFHSNNYNENDSSLISEQCLNKQTEVTSFQITPECGHLLAMSPINISIQFTPKCLGYKKYRLIVDVVNVGNDEHWIPILTEAIRPEIIVTPEFINLTRCFINHPYVIELTLTNKSTQPASYQFIEQSSRLKETNRMSTTIDDSEYSNENKLQYWTNNSKGIISESNSVKLSVTFKAKVLGLILNELRIKICGIDENPLKIPVRCIGEGPVLHVEETKLDWGTIPVLQPIVKVLKISNESCIDAHFTTKMLRNDTVFEVESTSGIIPGYSHIDMNIIANLNDIILFKDQLEIQIENTSKSLKIDLIAIGQGGTIVIQPSIGSILNLGHQFSVNPMRKQFKVINKGRRQQQLIWSIEGQSLRKSIHSDNQSLIKPETKWTITPHRFEINPGASTEICLEVQCDSPKTVHEKILCHSIIGRSAKYLIKTVDVSIDFITPVIELSSSELFYRVEKGPSDELSIQFNRFTMTNKVDLILTCSLEVCNPFYLYLNDNHISTMTFQMNPFESKEVTVSFNPLYKEDLISRRADELLFIKYAEHPQTDALRLIGEVHFPNLQLDTDKIDFGCILNNTEMTKHLNMKNVSPLPVKFRWSLLIGDRTNIIFKRQARLTEYHPSEEINGTVHFNESDNKIYEQIDEIDNNNKINESIPIIPTIEINTQKNDENILESMDPNSLTPKNSVLCNLLEEDGDIVPLGIEELFDIVPLYGEIIPEACVIALCEVDGGPEYKIELKGSASEINYIIDQTDINLGYNRMDKPIIYKFNIMNIGKVNFNFSINLPSYRKSNENIQKSILFNYEQYGQLKIEPLYGQVNSYKSYSIQLTYISFRPGYFEQEIDIIIGHFLPKRIKFYGITEFAHLILNLPRTLKLLNVQSLNIEHEFNINKNYSLFNYTPCVYELTMQKLINYLYKEIIKLIELWEKQENILMICLCKTIFSTSSLLSCIKNKKQLNEIFIHDKNCFITKALKQILAKQYNLVNKLPENILQLIPDIYLQLDAECAHICSLLNNPTDVMHNNTNSKSNVHQLNIITESEEPLKPLPLNNLSLPHYLLDFGIVIMGTSVKQCIYAINTSYEPITFRFDTISLSKAKQLGFNTNITKIHHLPGYPDYEKLQLEITFDTKQISQIDDSLIQTELIIKVLNGPSVSIWLKANIIKPMLKSHINNIDFGEVQRGEARLITVQLYNPSPVSIKWNQSITELQTHKNIMDTVYPIRICYKSRQNRLKEKQLRIFEVVPNRGILQPNEKTNIQIKFTPIEEKRYETKILLNIENSDTVLKIQCHGKGLEPQLIFDRSLLQFSPTLPFSPTGSEEIVTVTNPCDYPIEFYSIELDKQFAQEDEILRSLDGYDEYGSLLLPPRKPGDPLPSELITYYEEQMKMSHSKLSEESEENIEEKNVKELKFSEVPLSSWKETKKSITNYTSTSESERNKSDSRSTSSDVFLDNIKREDSKIMNLNIHTNGEKQTFDITPVTLAISRYLGIDSTPESHKSSTLGIVIFVNGALASIRRNIVNKLADKYQAIILNINQIIIEALLTSSTETAGQARQICLDVGEQIIQAKLAEKQREQQEQDQQRQPQHQQQLHLSDSEIKLDSPKESHTEILKDETLHEVDLHTSLSNVGEQSKVIGQNKTINRQGQGGNKSLGHRRTSNELGKPSSSPKLNPFSKSKYISLSILNYLNISSENISNNSLQFILPYTEQLYTTFLPDEIIIRLIQERLKYPDCINANGIIIDGLESDFIKNSLSTIEILLKCFKDCKYTYTISIKSDYERYKQCITEIQADINEAQLLKNTTYYKKLDDLTDYEYEELSDNERKHIDELQLKIRREKRQIELEQKRIHAEQLREEQEAEIKRLEMERNNKRRGKRMDDKPLKPNTMKDNVALSGRMSSKSTRDVINNMHNNNVIKSDLPEKSPLGVLEETRRTSRSHEKHRKSATSFKDEALTEEEIGVHMTDEEQLTHQIFKSFEGEFLNICELLSTWNRITLQQQTSLLESREDSPTSTIVNLPAGKRTRQSGLNLPLNSISTNLNKSKHSISKCEPTSIPQVIHENLTILLPIYCDLNILNENQFNHEKDSSDSQIIGIPHLIVEFPFKKETNITEVIKKEITRMLNDSDIIHIEHLIGTKIKEYLLMTIYETNEEGEENERQQHIEENKLSNELCQLLSFYLPELNDILNYLDIGPNGPKIPKSNNFSIIYYPINREIINNLSINTNDNCYNYEKMNQSFKTIKVIKQKLYTANLKYYEFLYSGQGDPITPSIQMNGLSQVTGSVEEENDTVESSIKQKEAGESLRKTVGRSNKKERKSPRQKHPIIESGETTSRKPKFSVTSSNVGYGGGRHSSITSLISEQVSLNDEISSVESNQILIGQPLNHFRWIIPAKGKVQLRIRFRCERIGQFDQIFNFELLNTRRIYQLYCRGVCMLPTISREPRLIYPIRKRTINPGEIVHGTYLMSTSCFEFGPLLIEKSKERIQENCYPENITYFNLVNTSQMVAEIKLGFLNDPQEDCYNVQPNELCLKPNQSTTICLYAYPKLNKRYNDVLVCSIKNNPEPILFKLACDGVLPELELDKKVFNFEKVLLQRKEVRSIVLKNNTLLPAQWRLSGIETLGDEFSISQDTGIVEPQSESILYAYFRAMKPIKSNQKKSLRLEVYDLENIAGLIQVETIQVIAEAYDVALDINFPKGSDGGIDFGLIKVGEEVKHTIILKNKGPYEIVVNFIFSKNTTMKKDYSDVFTLTPQRVNLSPSDKSAQINLTCCAQSECILKEEQVIKCQIVEPNAKGTPQLIASIPIKLSLKAVFSKFTISPSKDINFGSLILSNHKTRQLIIENNGEYEFRYSIIRMCKMLELIATREAYLNKESVGTGKHKM
ncbi:unnamed protein product [Heterobilharzia americana]|nr:unnamed protein product [Heterobilharzia americana]